MIRIIKADGNELDFLREAEKRKEEKSGGVEFIVREIINDVKENGDEAVKKYTAKFDCEDTEYYLVPEEVMNQALTEADEDFINAMLNCVENITVFHQKQLQNGYAITEENGVMLGQRVRGLDRVGIYVPGGIAAYPSSVLMNAIPAKIAGVKEIIMVTPPLKNGEPNKDILVAAKLCGVDKVFMCGGAQAIAALAFGTKEIPRVSKIVGPGNIYVAMAKKLLYGTVDIDMVAGPSEILILADDSANPKYIAADLMSQAEHDLIASSILITTSERVAFETKAEIESQIKDLSRADIITSSLKNYGAIIITNTMAEAVALAEIIAPEHLEVLTENPLEYIGRLNNVGSLFLGQYSPEPLGDYYAGPNHILPTSGTARFFSPLSVDSFIKKSSYIYYTKQALIEAAGDITLIAEREQLTAHANSIKVRVKE